MISGVLVIFFVSDLIGGQSADLAEVERLVKQWAPLVWLSPSEKFKPLAVEDFLNHVYVSDETGNKFLYPWSRLPKNKSKGLYLVTYRSLDRLKNDSSSFLFGKNPNQHPVPVYAIINHCPWNNNPKEFYFHVSYWIFYPYNEGKEICFLGRVPTPRLFNKCLGHSKTMGNHVGDWEHMSLSFAGKDVPEKMYLAVHNTGVYYRYDVKGKYFKYESKVKGKGITQSPKFPLVVRTQGEHPVIFAAHGSHGLWASPGEYDYVRVPRLTDKNGYGIPWKTWNNVQIYHLGHTPLPDWMNFKGKWGNPKNNCVLLRKLGLCEHTDGPIGILREKQDFYCWPK